MVVPKRKFKAPPKWKCILLQVCVGPKMEAQRTSRMEGYSAPKMEAQSGTKMEAQTGPKMEAQSGCI